MKSALDAMLDSAESCIVKHGEYPYPFYTIEGGGPKFLEFIEWLKRTPYKEYVYEPVEPVKEPEDGSISW